MDWGIFLNTAMWAVGALMALVGFIALSDWVEDEYGFSLFPVVIFVGLIFVLSIARTEYRAKNQPVEQVRQ